MSRPHERTQAVDCYGSRPRFPMAALPPAQGGIQILGTQTHRERKTQIMFETFCVSAMYVAIHTALTTSTMMISGDGVPHTVPIYDAIYDDYAHPHAVPRLHLVGRNLTVNLMKFPSERELPFATDAEMSKRILSTLARSTTESSNRLRKSTRKRPTSSQTETSALLVLSVSVASKCCSSRFPESTALLSRTT